jgi:cold shock CspA family protein
MAKSQDSFNKKEKEKQRRKKNQEKLERREQRKAEKSEGGPLALEDMFSYVDENGNLSSTPPDPSKKKVINVEDIVLGASSRYVEPEDPTRHGRVKFFNEDKGYGFVVDNETKESIFLHANNLQVRVRENDRITFEIEMGPKGANAVNVKLEK